jgi:hypothetical protein
MSELTSKLALISERKAKLEEEYKSALLERKQKIGELASKFQLLEMSDAFFTGLFSEAQKANKDDKANIKNIEAKGSSLLTKKKKAKEKEAA